MRKSIGNRVITVIMVLMMTVTGMGITDTVMAGNTDETSWTVQVYANEQNKKFINPREKYDNSKIYINWTGYFYGAVSTFIVAPYASVTSVSDKKPVSFNSGANANTDIWYRIPAQGQYLIPNYAKQRQFNYATLAFRGKNGSGYVTGVWSPDSTDGSGTTVSPD